jgi:hypothetical protein
MECAKHVAVRQLIVSLHILGLLETRKYACWQQKNLNFSSNKKCLRSKPAHPHISRLFAMMASISNDTDIDDNVYATAAVSC